ncbi:MAG: isoaspartyl peptidase/L-asparaginase, partial [Planctomycetaceae bacterium]
AVAALRDVRHAARVARLVMRQTNRVLLAGDGARDFALANGFPSENLLTDKARRMWLHWKRLRSSIDDWRDPQREETDEEILEYFDKHYGTTGGTVHCAALDASNNLGCTTSTSGHAFKMPGRIGDSPILGAGVYVDNPFGSCGSVGHGEANLENLSSFLAVELLRQGASPEEAGLEVLRRVAEHAADARHDDQGRPKLHLQLFLLHKDGRYCGVTLWGPKRLAVTDADGTRWEDSIALFNRQDPSQHGTPAT